MSKYDKQIARLLVNPRDIIQEWSHGIGLFRGVGVSSIFLGMAPYVCLTQMRNYLRKGESVFLIIKGQPNVELTKQLAEDDRIPHSGSMVNVNNLIYFKEWYEKIDKLNNS